MKGMHAKDYVHDLTFLYKARMTKRGFRINVQLPTIGPNA